MLFQGQEFLEDRWFNDREPLDWGKATPLRRHPAALPRPDPPAPQLVDGTTRGLRGHHVDVHHVNEEDKVLAFHRWDKAGPGDDVIVVAQLRPSPLRPLPHRAPASGRWRVRFNSDWAGYSALFDDHSSVDTSADADADGMAHSGDVGIGRYTAIVLSQDAI